MAVCTVPVVAGLCPLSLLVLRVYTCACGRPRNADAVFHLQTDADIAARRSGVGSARRRPHGRRVRAVPHPETVCHAVVRGGLHEGGAGCAVKDHGHTWGGPSSFLRHTQHESAPTSQLSSSLCKHTPNTTTNIPLRVALFVPGGSGHDCCCQLRLCKTQREGQDDPIRLTAVACYNHLAMYAAPFVFDCKLIVGVSEPQVTCEK